MLGKSEKKESPEIKASLIINRQIKNVVTSLLENLQKQYVINPDFQLSEKGGNLISAIRILDGLKNLTDVDLVKSQIALAIRLLEANMLIKGSTKEETLTLKAYKAILQETITTCEHVFAAKEAFSKIASAVPKVTVDSSVSVKGKESELNLVIRSENPISSALGNFGTFALDNKEKERRVSETPSFESEEDDSLEVDLDSSQSINESIVNEDEEQSVVDIYARANATWGAK